MRTLVRFLPIMFLVALGCGGTESDVAQGGEASGQAVSKPRATAGCHWRIDVSGDESLEDERDSFPGAWYFDLEGDDGDRHFNFSTLSMATMIGYELMFGISDDAPAQGFTGDVPLVVSFRRWEGMNPAGSTFEARSSEESGSAVMTITENSAEWFAADIEATLHEERGGTGEIHVVASVRVPRGRSCG